MRWSFQRPTSCVVDALKLHNHGIDSFQLDPVTSDLYLIVFPPKTTLEKLCSTETFLSKAV